MDLLGAILRDSPKLEGCLCANRQLLFDAEQLDDGEREHAVNRAKGICTSCPCLKQCAEWAATQDRLLGVVAGELRGPCTKGRAA